MMRREQLHGREGFLHYYRQWFDSDSAFETFMDELMKERLPIILFNPHDSKKLQSLWESHGLKWQLVSWMTNAVYWPEGVEKGTLLPGFEEHAFFVMNISSLLPVMALEIQGDEMVLDACAAPGGKLFAIHYLLDTGTVIANERSFARREKLIRTVSNYDLGDIAILGTSAETLFKTHASSFDKILLDAPCSSEKHVFGSSKYLSSWSPYRIRQLKQAQYSLLSGLLLSLKVGGRLVYSTCAVTPEENELVIEQILKKKSDTVRLVTWNPPSGAPGSRGLEVAGTDIADKVWRVWPTGQADPMFVAVLERTE